MTFKKTHTRNNPVFGTYENDIYKVIVQAHPYGNDEMYWVKVTRHDDLPIHNWMDLQDIKNTLIGKDHEGFEIYPADDRLVDEGNAYHLWVYRDPGMMLDYGFLYRRTKPQVTKVEA